eukprot:5457086-Amphidinium_carterae.1
MAACNLLALAHCDCVLGRGKKHPGQITAAMMKTGFGALALVQLAPLVEHRPLVHQAMAMPSGS